MDALSAPLPDNNFEDDISLKEQHSAPFKLNSLEHNEVPPFKKPAVYHKPKLLLWTFTDPTVTRELVETSKLRYAEVRKSLDRLILDKNFCQNYEVSEKQFLSSLLLEAFRYGQMNTFNNRKISSLLAIYATTHKYFKSFYWLSLNEVWAYFKELLFRHSIDDTPAGEEIFEPQESYDIMTHFHSVYMCNLPLIHIRTFSAHRLKLTWPFQA